MKYLNKVYNEAQLYEILKPRCTTKHTGTSASAPMAAAIIALTLQAIIMILMKVTHDCGDDNDEDDDSDEDNNNNDNDDESAQANPDLTWRDVQHIMVRAYYLK